MADYWAGLEESGWLHELPIAAHAALRARLETLLQTEPQAAYTALADTSFDAEMIEDMEPASPCSYTSLIAQLARHSRGAFAPIAIREQRTAGDAVVISFEHGGKSFSCRIPIDDDWVRAEVFDLINEALGASDTAKRVFVFPPLEQTVYVAFVPERVYKRAERLGLVPTCSAGRQ